MIELKINKADINRMNRLLDELDVNDQGKAIHKGVLKACSTVTDRLSSNVSGVILKRRTGNLANSVGFRIQRDDSGVFEGIIGSGASLSNKRMIYANIHEKGGVIRPVRARMLAIPLKAAQTPAGVARFTPNEVRQGLTTYDGSFIRKSKAGNLIIFGKQGSGIGIKVVPLFILKDQVKIPARRYMGITVDQTKEQVVQDIVGKIEEAKEKAI